MNLYFTINVVYFGDNIIIKTIKESNLHLKVLLDIQTYKARDLIYTFISSRIVNNLIISFILESLSFKIHMSIHKFSVTYSGIKAAIIQLIGFNYQQMYLLMRLYCFLYEKYFIDY